MKDINILLLLLWSPSIMDDDVFLNVDKKGNKQHEEEESMC